MADYGMRISKNGVDVKTGDDIDMAVTSKYANMKGTLSGQGFVSVPSGNTQTVTISHGLGYIPIIRAFIKLSIYDPIDDEYKDVYQEIPIEDTGSSSTYWEFFAYCDSSNAYITFYWGSAFGSTNTFYYSYLIFIDKGKL